MRLRPTQFLFSLLLLAVLFASDLNAQTTISGALTGVLTDQSNAVVPNADVEIKDNSKGITQSTKTDHEGVYRFFFLAPARYVLVAPHDGFREKSRMVQAFLGRAIPVQVRLEMENA